MVVEKLCELRQLPAGWDSYSAPAIKPDACWFAIEILSKTLRSGTPLPQIVPSSVGGVQLEWHEEGIDLEIHVTGTYQADVWYENTRTHEQFSAEISNDFSMLSAPITALTLA